MVRRKDKTAPLFFVADRGEIGPTGRAWRQKKFADAKAVVVLLEEEPTAFITRANIPRKKKVRNIFQDVYIASVVIPGVLGKFRSIEIEEGAMDELLTRGVISMAKPNRWTLIHRGVYDSHYLPRASPQI